jgi:hypothetical protein
MECNIRRPSQRIREESNKEKTGIKIMNKYNRRES